MMAAPDPGYLDFILMQRQEVEHASSIFIDANDPK